MKRYLSIYSLAALSCCCMMSACNKEELLLSGSASEADFSFAQMQPGDTLPYLYNVSFTNNSKEATIYQWNFGDNGELSALKDPVHTYKSGGTYNVTLTTVGTNGNKSLTKVVAVTDACQNDLFSKLTNCATGEWTWSTDADAIKVMSPDATQVYFSGAAAGCQADDVFKFSKDGAFSYDANGQTLDAQAGFSCQPQKANAQKYKLVVKAGQLPKIMLDPLNGTGSPFIGTTDVIEGNAYTVQSYSATNITLRGKDATNGNLIEIKLKRLTVLTSNDIFAILTGGSTKRWKLDPDPAAKAIIVGTENNPGEYFGGGTLEACQLDDIYTFSTNNTVNYNAAGATFNGGNIAPNYNCGADRSYNILYSFGPTTGGVAGLGTILLPGAPAPPGIFIGVTDVPAENVYRIIEITASKMVLRAGNGSGTVFQFKFIAL